MAYDSYAEPFFVEDTPEYRDWLYAKKADQFAQTQLLDAFAKQNAMKRGLDQVSVMNVGEGENTADALAQAREGGALGNLMVVAGGKPVSASRRGRSAGMNPTLPDATTIEMPTQGYIPTEQTSPIAALTYQALQQSALTPGVDQKSIAASILQAENARIAAEAAAQDKKAKMAVALAQAAQSAMDPAQNSRLIDELLILSGSNKADRPRVDPGAKKNPVLAKELILKAKEYGVDISAIPGLTGIGMNDVVTPEQIQIFRTLAQQAQKPKAATPPPTPAPKPVKNQPSWFDSIKEKLTTPVPNDVPDLTTLHGQFLQLMNDLRENVN